MAEGPSHVSRGSLAGRLLVLSAAVAVVGLLGYGLATTSSNETIDQALSASSAPQAPGFELQVLDRGTLPRQLARTLDPALADGQLGLDELRGTPLVLNFWASWCDPCREEAPILQEGWRRWGRRGVLFVGLDMQDLTDDALAFIEEFAVSYPTIRDPEDSVSLEYGVTGIPETFFIDARGRVVAHVIGVVTSQQLDRGAQAARAGEVVPFLPGGSGRFEEAR